ncbi:MAG TPA: hypothetical protein VF990_08270 [Candidatus Dormibacteraeota bacterium]
MPRLETAATRAQVVSRSLIGLALALAGALTWQGSAHAQTHRAALVVQHSSSWPGSHVLWKCVEFAQEAIGGLALLQLAGVNSGQPPQIYDWGGGAYTVCQLDRQPQVIPDRCFGPISGPNWSDWTQTANGWVARATGVAGYTVRDGDVEGWSYSTGRGMQPPSVSFNQVCPAAQPPTAAAPSRRATPSAGAGARATPPALTTSIESPSPAMEALAPSVSPSAGTALAATGPPTSPPAGGLLPWLLLGGAAIVLSGLGAINLRRRGQ